MGINESLKPSSSLIVLNLDDVGQDRGAVGFGEEFQSWRMSVERSAQGFLSNSCRVTDGNGRRGRGNGF